MNTNYTNKNQKLIYPEESYLITGVCFEVHNQLGRFAKERQYGNLIEEKFRELKIDYLREYNVRNTGNKVDFLVADVIVLELRAKKFILKEDYYQIQRYLQILDKKLGLLVNFRSRYIKPVRVVKIETNTRNKYLN